MNEGTACAVCGAKTDGFLCKSCCAEVERAIGDMGSLMHEVSIVATKQTRIYRSSAPARSDAKEVERWDAEQREIAAWLRSKEGRIALPSTPMPINLDARELLWCAGNTLSTWVRHLADSRGAQLPDAAGMVAWLLRNVDAIRYDEAAAQLHDEITSLHRELEQAVDRSPSRFYAGPCHAQASEVATFHDDAVRAGKCQRDLYARPGADEVVCDGHRGDRVGCGAAHTLVERREWLVEALSGALVGVDELVSALPRLFPDYTQPPRGVVQSWIRSGRLMAHGLNQVGEPTFLASDLLELIAAYRPREYAPRPTRRAS